MNRFAFLPATLALLLAASPSVAAVHKCIDASGKTIYQDAPCPSETRTGDIPKHIADGSGPQERIEVQVGATDHFVISLPAAWHGSVRTPPGIQAPTLSARSANGGMSLDMTFIPIPEPVDQPEQLLARVMTGIASEHENDPNSRRSKLFPFSTPNIPGGLGAHFAFKDESLASLDKLPDGEYAYMSAGAVIVGQVLINFTVLTNDLQSPAYRTAVTNIVNLSNTAP
ncbi:MAG: DUF4124 domain-containing protein [Rhodanobacteraceae bacterium]|nr:DUF4124 domain-containing protein [Rhodanobacteraceae bacterium]HPF74441.1 DUF4124 domain-containing protein [Xanthomonadaceae bacterium]HRX99568.1 DUF4124 domain-containing protein [Xanthomonadaceae bacterium]